MNQEPEWKVQFKGNFETHFEIAVIHKDNSHGRISFGWGCEYKIILFSSGVGGNNLNMTNKEFGMKAAQILCEGLNTSDFRMVDLAVPNEFKVPIPDSSTW